MADSKHMIEVHVKSLPYQPRGKAAEYRPGSVQILEAEEAYELEKAGIVTIVTDPYLAPVTQEPFQVYMPGPDIILDPPQAPVVEEPAPEPAPEPALEPESAPEPALEPAPEPALEPAPELSPEGFDDHMDSGSDFSADDEE